MPLNELLKLYSKKEQTINDETPQDDDDDDVK
jgi:hypothetical protein